MARADPQIAAPVEDHRFPCPTCGADLRYAPGRDALACGHCGHEEAVPDLRGAIPELDLRAAIEDALPPAAMEQTRVVQCASCGARVEFDAARHARECPFCASPIVSDTGLDRHIKPQAQLPFLLSEAEARAAMNRWLGRLWFAPSNLTQFARAARALEGVYVPYWTYDAETTTNYTGQRGRTHYETRRIPTTINGRRRTVSQQVARTSWTRVRGRVSRAFDDVLVLGARSLPRQFTDAIAPWDLSALSAYEPRYLAGFRAEGYTVTVDEGLARAREIMDDTIRADIRRDIGGDQQRIGEVATQVGATSFKHVLLPMWLAAYRYRGRSFRFVVNGRTGAVAGERPYSRIKVGLAILAAILAALILAALQIAGN